MPVPIPQRYALDLTGTSTDNLVIGEIHNLTNRKIRSIATKYGPYYTESVKVYDHITNRLLNRNQDYNCLDIVGLPTAQSGKEICSILVITNPTVSAQVRLEYQVLGGGYERSYEAIKKLIDELTDDNRPIEWPNVLNRPVDFNPNMHLHRLGDVIGFEYVVSILEQLKNTIFLGDQLGHNDLLDYIDYNTSVLIQLINNAQNASTVVAMARATNANNAATLSLEKTNQIDARSLVIEQDAKNALGKSFDLLENIKTSESRSQYILQMYPLLFNLQNAANMNFNPVLTAETDLLFPMGDSSGLISRDYYSIDYTGKIINGLDDDFDPNENNDLIFLVELSTHKTLSNRQAQVRLRVNLFDQRNHLGVGYYGANCALKLFPMMFDSGSHVLSSAFATDASYVYSEAPWNGVVTGMTYGVDGVDSNNNISLKVDEAQSIVIAKRISNYLLDHRVDWNVKNYGAVNLRRAVNINLNPGSELTFVFNLRGTDIAQIRRDLILQFRHNLRIMQATKPSTTLVQTIIKNGPDKDRVRSISAKF